MGDQVDHVVLERVGPRELVALLLDLSTRRGQVGGLANHEQQRQQRTGCEQQGAIAEALAGHQRQQANGRQRQRQQHFGFFSLGRYRRQVESLSQVPQRNSH